MHLELFGVIAVGGEMEKRIPVPRGQEPPAERVVEALQKRGG